MLNTMPQRQVEILLIEDNPGDMRLAAERHQGTFAFVQGMLGGIRNQVSFIKKLTHSNAECRLRNAESKANSSSTHGEEGIA